MFEEITRLSKFTLSVYTAKLVVSARNRTLANWDRAPDGVQTFTWPGIPGAETPALMEGYLMTQLAVFINLSRPRSSYYLKSFEIWIRKDPLGSSQGVLFPAGRVSNFRPTGHSGQRQSMVCVYSRKFHELNTLRPKRLKISSPNEEGYSMVSLLLEYE